MVAGGICEVVLVPSLQWGWWGTGFLLVIPKFNRSLMGWISVEILYSHIKHSLYWFCGIWRQYYGSWGAKLHLGTTLRKRRFLKFRYLKDLLCFLVQTSSLTGFCHWALSSRSNLNDSSNDTFYLKKQSNNSCCNIHVFLTGWIHRVK